MERKACADCGSLCVDSERRCWSCGSASFMTSDPDDRTVLINAAADRTTSLRLPQRAWLAPAVLGGALAVTLLVGTIGYWIGRASALPEGSRTQVASGGSAAVHVPDVSHVPTGEPRVLAPAGSHPGPVGEGLNPSDPRFRARVTVRPGERAAARPSEETGVPLDSEVPPVGEVALPPAYDPPRELPLRAFAPAGAAPSTPAIPAPEVSAAPPPGHAAVVQFRNDDSTAVEIMVEGEDLRIRVAPHGLMPVNLAPGTYRLRASAAGLSSGESRLTVAAGRAYSLTVRRQRGSAGDSLVLVEPLADAAAG